MAAIPAIILLNMQLPMRHYLIIGQQIIHRGKSLTLVALQNIIKLPAINIPHKVKQDFLLYFDPLKYPLDPLQYKQLDLIAMAKALAHYC